MPHRFNIHPQSNFGVEPLNAGFSKNDSKDDLSIPSVGIVDMERALFNLFDKELPLFSKVNDGVKKIPIVFSSSEKWSLVKLNKKFRDRNGSLILPIISIVRTGLVQEIDDLNARGMNQHNGEIIVKRQLDETDRIYQSLINRLKLKNQPNLAVNSTDDMITETVGSGGNDQNKIITKGLGFLINKIICQGFGGGSGGSSIIPIGILTNQEIGDLSLDAVIADGGLLNLNRKKNVYEFLSIPTPQFYTATYTIECWAQYQEELVLFMETILSSFLPQIQGWRINTDKGYWFIALTEGINFDQDTNFDDMSNEERMMKSKFNVSVKGYILASQAPGLPVAIRRYISNPSVSFTLNESSDDKLSSVVDPFLGMDDPTLPISIEKNKRKDQRSDGSTRLYPGQKENLNDPALQQFPRGQKPGRYKKITLMDKTGKQTIKYVKIKNINKATGEMIFNNDFNLDGLSIVAIED